MSVVDMEEVLQECSCATDAAVDSEGYMRSFAVEDREGQCDFFRDFGFVVVHDVLSEEEVAASVDEIWRAAARAEQGGGVGEKEVESLRSDPERWSKVLSSSLGIFGGSPATGLVAWRNRENPRLHQVYQNLFPAFMTEEAWEREKELGAPPAGQEGEVQFLVSIDRWGVMPPTKDVTFGDGTVKDLPQLRTKPAWFHFDLNPWSWTKVADIPVSAPVMAHSLPSEGNGSANVGYPKVQSLLALSDSRENTGGFQCVPGFQRVIHQWVQEHSVPDFNTAHCTLDLEDPVLKFSRKITCRPGSLILWSSELPHCNFPNDSSSFRFCQYVKLMARGGLPELDDEGSQEVRRELVDLVIGLGHQQSSGELYQPSPLGKRLLGMQ